MCLMFVVCSVLLVGLVMCRNGSVIVVLIVLCI